MRRSLLVVALVSFFGAAFVTFAPPALAYIHPCSDNHYNLHSWRFHSTFDFYQNTASFPSGLPNLSSAMSAGPGGWNEFRTSCDSTPGTSWTGYRFAGTNTLTPSKADGYNTMGWENFSSPPGDADARCAQEMRNVGSNGYGYACIFVDSLNRLYEYGVSLNPGATPPWSTDLNATEEYLIVQAVMTHEYGHVSGVAHTNAESSTFNRNDDHAALTMYPWLATNDGRANYWPYTLGLGDMDGALAARP